MIHFFEHFNRNGATLIIILTAMRQHNHNRLIYYQLQPKDHLVFMAGIGRTTLFSRATWLKVTIPIREWLDLLI